MKTGKTIFVAGGIGIILILLAVRLGWFGKEKQPPPEKPVSTAAVVNKPAAVLSKTVPKQDPAPVQNRPPRSRTAEKTPPAAPDEKKKTDPSATSAKDFSKEEEALGIGDPFSYAAASSGDYTPLSGGKSVGVITVKGIICIEGGQPRAILHLKDSGRVHYVSKNSVIRVRTQSKNGTSPAEAYIVVKDIRNDEVELIQLERPDKVIIIR